MIPRGGVDQAGEATPHAMIGTARRLIVSLLVIAAIQAGIEEGVGGASSVLSEVAGLIETLGVVPLIYVFWLSNRRVRQVRPARPARRLPRACRRRVCAGWC